MLPGYDMHEVISSLIKLVVFSVYNKLAGGSCVLALSMRGVNALGVYAMHDILLVHMCDMHSISLSLLCV